ncbi:hypothetical protein D917_10252, partial [Trichinella nativa]
MARRCKRMRSTVVRFSCLFLKHLLHGIDMNFSDRESAALRTDLKKWVPLQWKQSVCKLLYKDGDKERLANWRPIALEPVLQRVLSAVVASRVTTGEGKR